MGPSATTTGRPSTGARLTATWPATTPSTSATRQHSGTRSASDGSSRRMIMAATLATDGATAPPVYGEASGLTGTAALRGGERGVARGRGVVALGRDEVAVGVERHRDRVDDLEPVVALGLDV